MVHEVLDPGTYPGTSTLVNRLGIRQPAALRSFEYEQTAVRLAELRSHPIAGHFDLAHLCAVHRHLFQDVYAWAGGVRIAHADTNGQPFADPASIRASAQQLGNDFANETQLRGLPPEHFVARLAHYGAAWNALHPFRGGNGRTLRVFIAMIASQAGYELDPTRIARDGWLRACESGFEGDLAPMRALLAQALRPAAQDAHTRQRPDPRLAYETWLAAKAMASQRWTGTPATVTRQSVN